MALRLMHDRQLAYLKAMGIQAWQSNTAPTIAQPIDNNWEALRQAVASCTACGLDKTRTQTVFGTGDHSASLMIIGEAPGSTEDKQGEPFVGRAGQLLTAMLQAIDIERESVYITNILKCRPPNNRDPQVAEVKLCTPFLQQQIALINPSLILAVGRIAAHHLLKTKTPLGELRNQIHTYGTLNTPLIVTYHPAYLLRNPADKNKAFQDLQLTTRTLAAL
jgi:uracil-DNA glycosylase family 4